MPDKQPIVQLKELSYEIGGRMIFDRVDLDILAGEIFAVMGLSGAGKTTLLRLIVGLIRPTSGSILIYGEDITTLDEAELNRVRRRIGLVFQYGALFDSLNVRENVGFWLYEHTNQPEEEIRLAVAENLRLVGLPGNEELYPSELSGGMQKRVGIARALVGQPRILLYDEPTSGLDPIIAANIDDLIVQLRDTLGVTEIVVSHDVANVLRKADRAALLYEGRLRMIGAPADFRASADPVVRQFLEGNTEGPIQVV